MTFTEYYAEGQDISVEEAASWVSFLRAVKRDLERDISGLETWCRRTFAFRIDETTSYGVVDHPKLLRDVGRAQTIQQLPALLRYEIDIMTSLYTAWEEEQQPNG